MLWVVGFNKMLFTTDAQILSLLSSFQNDKLLLPTVVIPKESLNVFIPTDAQMLFYIMRS